MNISILVAASMIAQIGGNVSGVPDPIELKQPNSNGYGGGGYKSGTYQYSPYKYSTPTYGTQPRYQPGSHSYSPRPHYGSGYYRPGYSHYYGAPSNYSYGAAGKAVEPATPLISLVNPSANGGVIDYQLGSHSYSMKPGAAQQLERGYVITFAPDVGGQPVQYTLSAGSYVWTCKDGTWGLQKTRATE